MILSRCQCFYGPSCSSNITDPCATYHLPPPLPKVFSTFYTTTVTTCVNKACTSETNIGELLQNATAGEQRRDEIGISWNTRFIFPFQYIENDDYIQVTRVLVNLGKPVFFNDRHIFCRWCLFLYACVSFQWTRWRLIAPDDEVCTLADTLSFSNAAGAFFMHEISMFFFSHIITATLSVRHQEKPWGGM